jgi:hypothetical protein
MTRRIPPRLNDLAALAKVGSDEPTETRLRLELLRRELGEVAQRDPLRVANFALVMAQGHAMLERQQQLALHLLAERQDEIEVLTARVTMAEALLVKEQRRAGRPRWWWW